VSLPGSGEGVKYFLVPNAANVAQHGGWGRLVVEAMNQAFFTLSLGIGSMAIFGSYIGRDRALAGESVRVTALDTVVAMAAGFIVIPACFAFAVEPGAGPGLLFVTLPAVFGGMPGGRLWGAVFFLFMSFAAFSTVLAVFENILACFRDLTGLSRRAASAVCAVVLFVLSLPCALGWSALSGFQPFGPDSGVLDLEDFVVSNLLLPIGSLAYVVFCTRRIALFREYRPGWGWGWRAFREEANRGEGLKVPDAWLFRFYVGLVLPLVIAILLVVGLNDKFGLLDKLR
jgi:NSS family neurotransmitter:Na+ symporter